MRVKVTPTKLAEGFCRRCGLSARSQPGQKRMHMAGMTSLPLFAGGVGDAANVGDGCGDGLFEEDVLAGLEGGDGDGGVGVGGGADADEVDGWVLDEFFALA